MKVALMVRGFYRRAVCRAGAGPYLHPAGIQNDRRRQILTYKTRQLPVYSYVAGAFVAGLLIGIFQALFTFIRLKAEIFRKNRVIRELELKVADLEQKCPHFCLHHRRPLKGPLHHR